MTAFTPLSSLAGGALIGVSTSLLLLYQGRVAGISGIVDAVLHEPRKNLAWRLPFVFGLLVTGLVASIAVPAAIAPAVPAIVPLAIAGVLVGFGTRLGNGCTSGHGISGLSRLSPRSVAATLTFMAAGMITTYLVMHLRGTG